MPTQEERLNTLEQTVALLQKRSSADVQDLNRNVTMVLGIASGQELDVKEIKVKLALMSDQQAEHTQLLQQILTRLPEKS